MEIKIVKAEKENPLQSGSEDREVADKSTLSISLVKEVKRKKVLVLNVKRSQCGENCTQESFLRHIHSLGTRIPKHIISLDEKYLRRCLELIYASATEGASCSISESLSLQMGNLSDSLSSLNIKTKYAGDLNEFVPHCPFEAETGNIVISPIGEWVFDTIMGRKSNTKFLKRPLLRQSGVFGNDINLRKSYLIDATKSTGSDFSSSPCQLSSSLVHKPEKEMVEFENDRFKSEAERKRLVSISSTSTISDPSPSSVYPNLARGMLHCTWKAGVPSYVFSSDDWNEVYIADIINPTPQNDKSLDYMYTFHTNESYLVGKMRVSTSFKLCPNNSEIKETEFVLFGEDERDMAEVQTSTSHTFKKRRGLSKKMSEVFKTGYPSRERTSSKFEGTNEKPYLDLSTNLFDSSFPPNLELAAVIVKDHVCETRREPEVGGWGMKFLKKVDSSQTNVSTDYSPAVRCVGNNGDCSTSMDILVPAGFHGGARNKIGGPSSLIERWRSGGRCDCGGWDVGCPLTVLDTKRSKNEALSQQDVQGDCQSFNLYSQGLTQGIPVMKMMNIHEGLYFIHFQSSLSALQSFSIAVAIIHTKSPDLQPKMYSR